MTSFPSQLWVCKWALTALVLPALIALAVRPGGPRYQHFEDYLSHLNASEQEWIARSDNDLIGYGNNWDDRDTQRTQRVDRENRTVAETEHSLPPETISRKNKDVTCCILGQLAGDKGYHCYAKFYVARLMLRNRNRAHNRKMAFHGHERVPNYGRRLMQTFQRCVAGRGAIFHKCCHLAALERSTDLPRYDTQRHYHHASNSHS